MKLLYQTLIEYSLHLQSSQIKHFSYLVFNNLVFLLVRILLNFILM